MDRCIKKRSESLRAKSQIIKKDQNNIGSRGLSISSVTFR